jgi:hypothetical protein
MSYVCYRAWNNTSSSHLIQERAELTSSTFKYRQQKVDEKNGWQQNTRLLSLLVILRFSTLL